MIIMIVMEIVLVGGSGVGTEYRRGVIIMPSTISNDSSCCSIVVMLYSSE